MFMYMNIVLWYVVISSINLISIISLIYHLYM